MTFLGSISDNYSFVYFYIFFIFGIAIVGACTGFFEFVFLLISIFIPSICVSSFLLLPLSFMSEGIIINPSAAMIPTIARPTPAHLATRIPLDHIFSPNMTPANNAIHNKFIQPKATIRRKYGQQQPRQ